MWPPLLSAGSVSMVALDQWTSPTFRGISVLLWTLCRTQIGMELDRSDTRWWRLTIAPLYLSREAIPAAATIKRLLEWTHSFFVCSRKSSTRWVSCVLRIGIIFTIYTCIYIIICSFNFTFVIYLFMVIWFMNLFFFLNRMWSLQFPLPLVIKFWKVIWN